MNLLEPGFGRTEGRRKEGGRRKEEEGRKEGRKEGRRTEGRWPRGTELSMQSLVADRDGLKTETPPCRPSPSDE